jgi:hypothetical protein
MIVIQDECHCETQKGEYLAFEDAVAELRRRASLPWDQEPNLCPCTGWRTCGRRYEIIEYDTSTDPFRILRCVPVLNVSAAATEWLLPEA